MVSIEIFQMQGLLLTVILSLIMLGIYVLIHLFSYILQDNSLRAKATTEYGQIILNVFIFFLIVVLAVPIIDNEILPIAVSTYDPYSVSDANNPNFELLDTATYNLTMQEIGIAMNSDHECLYSKKGFATNEGYAPHICVAISFLDKTQWLISETMTDMLILYNNLGIHSSFKLMVTAFVIIPEPPFLLLPEMISIMPFPGFSAEMAVMGEGFNLMSKSIMGVIIQKHAIDIIAQVLFPVLLIGGIVLRSFVFTRKFGGFLIAASLSLYYVAPMIYVIGHRAMFESGNFVGLDTTDFSGKYKLVPYADLMRTENGGTLSEIDLDSVDVNWLDPIGTIKNLSTRVKNSYNKIYSSGNAYLITHIPPGKGIIIEPNGYLHMVSKIAMLSIMIPLLTLLAVLASIKTMAPFFGGDASIAGLTHFL